MPAKETAETFFLSVQQLRQRPCPSSSVLMVGVVCVITGCHHLAEQVINTRSRVAGHLLGTFNGIIQRRQQYPTLHSQFIERATLYQGL